MMRGSQPRADGGCRSRESGQGCESPELGTDRVFGGQKEGRRWRQCGQGQGERLQELEGSWPEQL